MEENSQGQLSLCFFGCYSAIVAEKLLSDVSFCDSDCNSAVRSQDSMQREIFAVSGTSGSRRNVMRVIKVAILAFVLSCVIFSGPAEGVEITPIIVSMPDLPGELFSFDFVITDIDNLTREAQAFQAVISVSPGALTGNEAGSIEVRDELAY